MELVDGINHVALLTTDLDRFIDFYGTVFEADVVLREEVLGDPEPDGSRSGMRHALLRVGRCAMLHPFEVAGNPNGRALPTLFERGHLDHLALNAPSHAAFEEVRDRLTACGADPELTDFGAMLSVSFTDPDGMMAELCWIRDDLTDIRTPDHMVEATQAMLRA